jgi:hypothetical protein
MTINGSGQIDRIDFIGETVAIVTDYKTGRVSQGNAAENLQLRAYAVLVRKHFPKLEKIFTVIIQPMTSTRLAICEYDKDALVEADQHINNGVATAYMPNAPRIPNSDACKYCKAKSVCPEAQSEVTALSEITVPHLPSLTNNVLSLLLDRAEIVEDLITVLKSEAKARLKKGEEITGYKLGAAKTSRNIENAEEAFGKLQNIIDAAEFAKCCKVSVPQLEKIVAIATQTNPKEAKDKLAALLGKTMETKTGEPVMTRVK